MNNSLENFLKLYTTEGIGPKFLKRFHRSVGTFEGNFEELIDLFAERGKLPPPKVEKLKRKISQNGNFEKTLTLLREKGVKVIPFFDRNFPEDLKREDIAALFVVGNFDLSKAFSIVGTRKATAEGKLKASRFAAALASEGYTVVSGGAFGIDRAAHEGALAAGGKTAVVIGEGIFPFLQRESRFAEEVLKKGGAIISQFPPFMGAARWSFPKRNFLIAYFGLYGLLVVEAPKRSGALITVQYAERLKRPVFAYIGCTSHPNHGGTVKLVSEGKARLVVEEEFLLNLLKEQTDRNPLPEGLEISIPLREDEKRPKKGPQEGTPTSVSEDNKDTIEEKLLKLLSEGPKTFDQLSEILNLPTEELLTLLTRLEIEGKLLSEGGFYKIL